MAGHGNCFPAGAGKTILAQQMLYHHVTSSPEHKALYLNTLSEPTIKMLRYMRSFAFFDEEVFGERLICKDIGPEVRDGDVRQITETMITGAELGRMICVKIRPKCAPSTWAD